MSALAVPDDFSLDDLAVTANQEYELAELSFRDALKHAIRCGEALNAAHKRVPHGQWLRWLANNFKGDANTAYTFRRLASYSHEIPETATSIAEAGRSLLGTGRNLVRTDSVLHLAAEMKRMRDDGWTGWTGVDIAAYFGCSTGSVSRLTNPGALSRHREAVKRSTRSRKEARKALQREQDAKLVKAVGGDIAKAWSMATALARLLDGIRASEEPSDFRLAVAAALRSVYNAEDSIVRASKLRQ